MFFTKSSTATTTVASGSTSNARTTMTARDEDEEDENLYDEIEIEDMTYDTATQMYHYPCPCGDRFEIFIGDLRDGQDIAVCPSCSLMIRVIYEPEDLPKDKDEGAKGNGDKDDKKDEKPS